MEIVPFHPLDHINVLLLLVLELGLPQAPQGVSVIIVTNSHRKLIFETLTFM